MVKYSLNAVLMTSSMSMLLFISRSLAIRHHRPAQYFIFRLCSDRLFVGRAHKGDISCAGFPAARSKSFPCETFRSSICDLLRLTENECFDFGRTQQLFESIRIEYDPCVCHKSTLPSDQVELNVGPCERSRPRSWLSLYLIGLTISDDVISRLHVSSFRAVDRHSVVDTKDSSVL